tara:strand:- start:105 stop:689 length:585 start_codon:yes stop_codon:yes gene_type:complete
MIQTSFFPEPEKDKPIKIIQIAPSGLPPRKVEELVPDKNIPPDTYMIYSTGGYHPFYEVPDTFPRYQLPIWPCVVRIKYSEKYSIKGLMGAKKHNLREHHTTKHVNPWIGQDEYCFVTLQEHKLRLHRLVALAFIPNPEKYKLVLHDNDDPTNFLIENLKWGTHEHNAKGSINKRPDTPEQKYLNCVMKGLIRG